MGGTVGLTSEVGRGSIFWVALTTAEAPADRLQREEPLTVPNPALTPHSLKALYIEDNVANIKLIEHVLSYRPNVKLLTDVVEVLLRVRNLLETRALHLQIQNHNRLLEDLVRERTSELVATQKELVCKNEELSLALAKASEASELALSKQLVNVFGGDIGVENRLVGGTKAWFTVVLEKLSVKELLETEELTRLCSPEVMD